MTNYIFSHVTTIGVSINGLGGISRSQDVSDLAVIEFTPTPSSNSTSVQALHIRPGTTPPYMSSTGIVDEVIAATESRNAEITWQTIGYSFCRTTMAEFGRQQYTRDGVNYHHVSEDHYKVICSLREGAREFDKIIFAPVCACS